MRKYRPFIIIIALILAALIANPFGLLDPLKNSLVNFTAPVTAGLNHTTLSIKNFFATAITLGDVIKENNRLEQDIIKLKAANIKLKETEHENEVLKQELKFTQSTQLQLIPASIIAKSATGYIDSVTINRGSSDGIIENHAVVSQGFLVGMTKNVKKDTAEVLLVTSNNSKIPGFLQDSRGTGIIQGGLKGLTIDDVELDIEPKIKEAVLSSDIGNILPRGIPIGYVSSVRYSQNNTSRTANISSPIAFSHLESVFVVK